MLISSLTAFPSRKGLCVDRIYKCSNKRRQNCSAYRNTHSKFYRQNIYTSKRGRNFHLWRCFFLVGQPHHGFIQHLIPFSIYTETHVENILIIFIEYFNRLSKAPDTKFFVTGYSKPAAQSEQKLFRVLIQQIREQCGMEKQQC